MKYIILKLDDKNIKPNSEIKGSVTVNYPGKYDGIVIGYGLYFYGTGGWTNGLDLSINF